METVLVGVDGSPGTLPAVRWAARRAVRGRARLWLVHVSSPVGVLPAVPTAAIVPAALPSTVSAPAVVDVDAQDRADRTLLESAADVARRVGPHLEVVTERRIGAVGGALVEASDAASLVVLGSRGLGPVAGVVLGSVGVYVSSHAACPTVVVHGDADRQGPVLVGIEGSDQDRHVAAFAMQEAGLLGVGLVAVHSWAAPVPTGVAEAAAAASLGERQTETTGRAFVERILAPLRRRRPEVGVEIKVTGESAAAALLDHADTAALVVVGSHGHGSLTGLVLASTSHAVLRRASCPVAVVRLQPEGAEAFTGPPA